MPENNFYDLSKRNDTDEDTSLSTLIDLYLRVLEIFDLFKDKIQVLEIKPKAGNLQVDEFSLDYINYLIFIREKLISVILVSKPPLKLTDKNLKLWFNLFLKNPRLDGMLIIFNDKRLSSLILKGEDLYTGSEDFVNFKDYISDKYVSLDETLRELTFEKKYEFFDITFEKYEISNVINDFEIIFLNRLESEIARTRIAEKKEFLKKFDQNKVRELMRNFELYLESDKKGTKEFEEFLTKLE